METCACEDILDFRQVAKLVGTYGENIIALVEAEGQALYGINKHNEFPQEGRIKIIDLNEVKHTIIQVELFSIMIDNAVHFAEGLNESIKQVGNSAKETAEEIIKKTKP